MNDAAATLAFRRLALALALLAAMPAMAGGEVNTGYFGNVAIKGYDPVAYFTRGQAMQGSEEHSLEWLGALWRFSSDEHRQLFAANPIRYAPQYGGHCATGMAIHGGLTKDIDPQAWAIVDGKLYLNYSKTTQKLMQEGLATPKAADAKWEKHVKPAR